MSPGECRYDYSFLPKRGVYKLGFERVLTHKGDLMIFEFSLNNEWLYFEVEIQSTDSGTMADFYVAFSPYDR